ncbi:hypothetical protein Q8A67_024369 [Cirrhinus molitorella]|uniref:Uncharacterized protein n=1 Tax=Cirrhinus molitorella TaxID=172907 RepID=A0AA88NYC9_9TELE|nr:hypothetical protein Q8A67_024369 [Cirrhinus molitorella]
MEDGGEESRDEVAMDGAQGEGMHVGREREELPGVGSAKSLTWEWDWQRRDSLCESTYESALPGPITLLNQEPRFQVDFECRPNIQ